MKKRGLGRVKQIRAAESTRKTRNLAAFLLMAALAVGGMFAQPAILWTTSPTSSGPGTYQTAPAGFQAQNPSKEYIYAGGRLLATEEEPSTPPPAGNHSLSLNSTSTYVSVPDSPSLDITGPFTVEAWIKANNPTAEHQGLVERYNFSAVEDGGFALRLIQGKLQLYTIRSGNTFDVVTGNSVITSGWHHVAGVWDGSELRLYIDGVLNGFKSSFVAPAAGTAPLYIGAIGVGGPLAFTGLIDEVRVTAAALYTGQSFTVEPHLTSVGGIRGLWKFNDQTAADTSGNNNNGTPIGGATYSSDG